MNNKGELVGKRKVVKYLLFLLKLSLLIGLVYAMVRSDEWEEPLARLHSSPRASKAERFALAIGDDADCEMLQRFLGSPEARVFRAHEARQIKQFFRWVTMTVTTRSRSINPNLLAALEDLDY